MHVKRDLFAIEPRRTRQANGVDSQAVLAAGSARVEQTGAWPRRAGPAMPGSGWCSTVQQAGDS
jgi:hypothetical protein